MSPRRTFPNGSRNRIFWIDLTRLDTLNRQFRLHLHRGISSLATPNKIRGIGDLVELVARE